MGHTGNSKRGFGTFPWKVPAPFYLKYKKQQLFHSHSHRLEMKNPPGRADVALSSDKLMTEATATCSQAAQYNETFVMPVTYKNEIKFYACFLAKLENIYLQISSWLKYRQFQL